MKKYILLALLVWMSNDAYAQQNTFEKVIDTLGCGNASCIKETYDGGYVFCGSTIFNDAIIVKLDSIGTIEWAKVYGGTGLDGANYLEQTSDSGFIVSAEYDVGLFTQNWLLRLDINGDTLWTKKYSIGNGATNGTQTNSMAIIADSIYGQTGRFKPYPFTGNNASFIGSLSDGTWTGQRLYKYSAYQTVGYAIDKTFDFGFIISAEYDSTTTKSDYYLIRTNAYGDTIWTRTYDYSKNDVGMAVQQTSDSGFIVAGYTFNAATIKYNIFLFKTNTGGDTLWSKMYGDSLSCESYSVSQTDDGGYIIVGRIVDGTPPDGDLYLLRTNSYGDTLWTQQYGGSMNDLGLFVMQTKDNGYLMSGLYRSPGGGGAYIIKTDSLGYVASGIGLAELNNPFGFDVFPNPSKGLFTIYTKGIPEKNLLLTIFNVSNQSIYQCAMQRNSTEQIDLSSMPNGIYFVMLTTSKNRYSKKIILQ